MQKSLFKTFLKHFVFSLLLLLVNSVLLEQAKADDCTIASSRYKKKECKTKTIERDLGSDDYKANEDQYIKKVSNYFNAKTRAGRLDGYGSYRNDNTFNSYCTNHWQDQDFRKIINYQKKDLDNLRLQVEANPKNTANYENKVSETKKELDTSMRNCNNSIKTILKFKKASVQKTLEFNKRFEHLDPEKNEDKLQLDQISKQLREANKDCQFRTSQSRGTALGFLKVTIAQVQTPSCQNLTKYLDLYREYENKLFNHKKNICRNATHCVAKLKQLVNEDYSNGLRKICDNSYNKTETCCLDPSHKECDDRQDFLNDLKTIETSQCAVRTSLVNQLISNQNNFCNKTIEQCEQTCDTAFKKFKTKFLKCFQTSSFDNALADNKYSACIPHIEKIFDQYEEVTNGSELTSNSSSKDFVNCKKEINKKIKKEDNPEEKYKQYSSETCTASIKNKGPDSTTFNSSVTPSPSQVSTTSSLSLNRSRPNTKPSGLTISRSNTSSPTDLSSINSLTGASIPFNSRPIKTKADTDTKAGADTKAGEGTGADTKTGEDSDNPYTMENTGKNTNSAEGAGPTSSPDSQVPLSTKSNEASSKKAQGSKKSLIRKILSFSLSSSSRGGTGSYLKGYKRNVSSMKKLPVPILPTQVYRSRSSGLNRNRFPIGTANQNIFEMVSKSMSQFCNTKIKHCYTGI